MSKFAGVVIEDTFLPYELLYYAAPDFLNIQVGSRVLVPLGKFDKPKLAYVLKIQEKIPEDLKTAEVKAILGVVEDNLFSEQIAQLFEFVSKTFLVPLHKLINRIYGTFTEGKIEWDIKVTDEKGLLDYLENRRILDNKKAIVQEILSSKEIAIKSLKGKTKLPINLIKDTVKALQEKGFVEIIYKAPKIYNGFLTIKNVEAFEALLKDKKLKKSEKDILLKIRKEGKIFFDEAIKGVKNGRLIVEKLIEENVVEFIPLSRKEKSTVDIEKTNLIIEGGSLRERSQYISNFLKSHLSNDGRALVIVNEQSLIALLKDYYEENFPSKVFAYTIEAKSEIRRYILDDTKIFITTPFSLFVDIDQLEYVIIEDASSKYLLPGDFLEFDTRLVAFKKSAFEDTSLIFSSYSLDDTLLYFTKKNFKHLEIKKLDRQNKRIVDMRKEYKSNRISPVSRYVESKIGRALSEEGNVALVLNRKPYSTFIVCRECGYIHRCPVCDTPLYYDSDKKMLFCPTCGHTEEPINVCPKCGSVEISYLGYGIQKLSKDLQATFKSANLVVLESGVSRQVYDSSKFKKTIFLGTEYIFSHLRFDNISFVVFINTDSFLNGSSMNTSIEAFKFLRQASFETFPNDIFIQTYEKTNFVLSHFKVDDEIGFLREELNYRKMLSYPPYTNLLEFRFSNEQNLDNIKSYIESFGRVYGPVKKYSGRENFFEISIRTSEKPKNILEKIIGLELSKNIIGVRVYPTPIMLNDITSV
jgi:primosomal protein N' (replication factor Y)